MVRHSLVAEVHLISISLAPGRSKGYSLSAHITQRITCIMTPYNFRLLMLGKSLRSKNHSVNSLQNLA